MSLKKYHEKRNFKHTSEPKGTKNSSTKQLHFVIQKHAASHLHYDFRLELNGVLKSWAVPKGPSLNPNIKRLAIAVEDHPYDYKDFEGIIPEGNYGAGKVIIWDEGFYEPICKEKTFSENLKKGHISLILEGKKLKGKFSLIQSKTGPKNNWLLIKGKDKFSTDKDILKKSKSVRSNVTLEKLNSPPTKSKTTISLSSCPLAPMPTAVHPMLAFSVNKPFDHADWLFEIKWDGYRIIAYVNNKKVKLLTRNQKDYTSLFTSISDILSTLKIKAVLDGEMVVVNEEGYSDFQLMQQFQQDHTGQLIYYVFDILWLNGRDVRHLPLIQRKQLLKQIIPKSNTVKLSDHVEKDGKLFFQVAKEHHLEGIMGKNIHSPYIEHKRVQDWLKIKSRTQQEAVICGYTAPRGARTGFGALVLGIYDKGHLQYAGHTGTGFSKKIIENLKPRLDKIAQSESPFAIPPKTNAPVTWVQPKLVCQVAFQEWTKDHYMRQPSFIGLREDKLARSVRRETKMKRAPLDNDTFQNNDIVIHSGAKVLQNSKRKSAQQTDKEIVKINRHSLTLTHLNKIYWPEEGYTKRDLINHYRFVAKIMLPYLKNRPQVLHRFPNGIEGKHFFQKDIDIATPEWLSVQPIYSESESKDIHYLIATNEASLIYMANLGCIEMNSWLSKINTLEHPSYCVLDLDPEAIEFEAVITVALSIHKFLNELDVAHYCKTSGATGLHIYIPLQKNHTFEQSKLFAQLIASHIHTQLPDITSVERSPRRRQGKVYIDYLQNRFGQTMAAPYSIRPRPMATVSTPLHWHEVKKGLSPQLFTIETIQKRLTKKPDPWADIKKHLMNINKVLKKLQ